MVADWMWYFQRNDAFLRNEWSNYTNWPYKTIPSNIVLDASSNLYVTGDYSSANQRMIMQTFGILFGGDYREIAMPSGIYNYVEKLNKSGSNICRFVDLSTYLPIELSTFTRG